MNRRGRFAVFVFSTLLPFLPLGAADTIGGETWTSSIRIRTVATEIEPGKWELDVRILDRDREEPILFRTLPTYTDRTKDLTVIGLDNREYRFTITVHQTSLETKLEVRDAGEPVQFYEARFQNQGRQQLAAADPSESVMRVGGRVLPPQLVRRTEPKYPDEAREYRVSGIVVIEATIDETGKVTRTRVVQGLPFGLSEAAEEAVMSWRFKPATMDGEPVRVAYRVTVEFNVHRAGE